MPKQHLDQAINQWLKVMIDLYEHDVDTNRPFMPLTQGELEELIAQAAPAMEQYFYSSAFTPLMSAALIAEAVYASKENFLWPNGVGSLEDLCAASAYAFTSMYMSSRGMLRTVNEVLDELHP